MATYTYAVSPPFLLPSSLIAPSAKTISQLSQSGTISRLSRGGFIAPSSETGLRMSQTSLPMPYGHNVAPGCETARPVVWEGVSVKEEPVDGSELVSLQQPKLINPEDFEVDLKDHIPANSLGEVRYLIADEGNESPGSNRQLQNLVLHTDEKEIKVEEGGLPEVVPVMIEPIKEEEDDSQMPPNVLSNELSYLDDPRLSMSPRDREIEPQLSSLRNGAPLKSLGVSLKHPPVSQSKIGMTNMPVKKSPKAKCHVSQPPAKLNLDDQAKSKSKVLPKKAVVTQKPGPKCSKILSIPGGSVGKVTHEERKKALRQQIEQIPLSKFVPCVVQLCEIPKCGIDCRCTVKAPYPVELKAITLSSLKNERSLNMFVNKEVNHNFPVATQKVHSYKQGGEKPPEPVQSMGCLMSSRTGVGKRKAKLSEKLRGYMEERNKVREGKLKVKNRAQKILTCPICDKQLNNLHNFKRHLISHNVDDILNINIAPKQVAKDPKTKAKKAQIKVNEENKKVNEEDEKKMIAPVAPAYTAIRALLEERPPETLRKITPKQVVESSMNELNKTDKASPLVLNVPQFKAGTIHKDNLPHMTKGPFHLGAGGIVAYESGNKTGEARITIALPKASELSVMTKPSSVREANAERTDNVCERKETSGRVIVIAPINDFSPSSITTAQEKTIQEAETCQKSFKDDYQPVEQTRKSTKRLSFEKSKKAMKLLLLNERVVNKRSPKVKARKLSHGLVKSSPGAAPSSAEIAESDNDSEATAPYGDDSDGDDEEYIPTEKQPVKSWHSIKGARKSTGGNHWINKQAKEKLKNALKGKGKRAETKALRGICEVAQSKQIRRPSRQEVKPPRDQEDVLNTSEDRDSGIDLESDGNEKKRSPKKLTKMSQGNENQKTLQMLSGELVSCTELWKCIQLRLDNRKQREAILCPMCDKPFNYPSALKRHVMMHTDEREFECPHCPKAFSRKPHLTEHIRVHTGERPFKCNCCPAAFAQRTNLMIHNRTHTGARPFKCPECFKRFRRQDAHTQHILTHHSNVKPYKCDECSAAFPCARYLRDHLRVHSKERPFKCNMCTAAFVCKKYLLLHVRALHLNERPFTCKLCPAKFAQSGKLTEHNRIHTGEKPYKCSSCGSCFSRSGHLRRHLLTHTGIRPHKCSHCHTAFTQQDHLKRHIKNIHKVIEDSDAEEDDK